MSNYHETPPNSVDAVGLFTHMLSKDPDEGSSNLGAPVLDALSTSFLRARGFEQDEIVRSVATHLGEFASCSGGSFQEKKFPFINIAQFLGRAGVVSLFDPLVASVENLSGIQDGDDAFKADKSEMLRLGIHAIGEVQKKVTMPDERKDRMLNFYMKFWDGEDPNLWAESNGGIRRTDPEVGLALIPEALQRTKIDPYLLLWSYATDPRTAGRLIDVLEKGVEGGIGEVKQVCERYDMQLGKEPGWTWNEIEYGMRTTPDFNT